MTTKANNMLLVDFLFEDYYPGNFCPFHSNLLLIFPGKKSKIQKINEINANGRKVIE